MGAAITLLVILTLSIVVVRIAAITLRLTGIPADIARFQARSAFSGAGFTTSEAEALVSHPIRRRVISMLMLWGNVGLVSVSATFVVSFVSAEKSMAAVSLQLLWLLGAIALLWFIALNPWADRVMCKSIDWLLRKMTSLGQRGPTELLQVTSTHGVAEHTVFPTNSLDSQTLEILCAGRKQFFILGIKREDGSYLSAPELGTQLLAGDRIIAYGSDEDHSALQLASSVV